ncbi:hypothetical protein QVD17_35150 [Tagetes erecta]|uniref:Non-specific lipid-transfer protein n=1 Tax=Tagetes erecta TaxID=13708 RepID=A0AAD8K0V9_TARER|nr:hypothetical protein QVD17_35150 [Tagetes erecta]
MIITLDYKHHNQHTVTYTCNFTYKNTNNQLKTITINPQLLQHSVTMKGSSKASLLLLITILSLIVIFVPSSDAVISCSTVIQDVVPCVGYLKSGSGLPPPACCSGAKALAAATSTTADKQAACSCLKSASRTVNPNPVLAKSLPGNCGIKLGFSISPNVDCTKIT